MRDYLRLLRFVRGYVWLFFLATACMGVSTVFEGVSLGMIVPLADRVLTNKDIIIPGSLPPFIAELIAWLNSLSPETVLKGMAAAIVVLFALKAVFLFLQNYLMNFIAQAAVRDVRNDLYKKLQELPLGFYSRSRTGDLISRVTNDTTVISNAISTGLTDLLFQSMQVILFAFLVFFINWKLALISLVLFPIIILPVVRVGQKIKLLTTETQKKMADLTSQLAETIQGVYIIKVFCREFFELQRFKNVNYQYFRFMMKSIKRTIVLSPFSEWVAALGATFILLIAGKEVIAGELSFGVFALFLGALLSMVRPFKKISGVHAINQRGIAAANRLYEVLDEQPEIANAGDSALITGFNDSIIFENVSFHYEKCRDQVLSHIDLRIKKNDIIALVGHSGAGKTTLVNLIPRLYDVSQGRLTIDGVDVRKIKLHSLRSLISVVSQEMILFNDTVKNNIAYGKDSATLDEVIEAAGKANAYEFINGLPEKFNTVVGDRGFRLSGGEKQRLAIARAILKDSPILILDEATSQLDTKSERLIQQALDNLMRGKTVFVIAHRLSTVQHATRIIVVDKGRIVEQGTHDLLMQTGTVYKKLYELQFNG